VSLSTSYSGARGFLHPWCGYQHALLRNILRPPPPLRRSKSTTILCETWYIVNYIAYCDHFIHAPSMEDNFVVFIVLYYNNLSSLLLTFAALTVSLSSLCIAWLTLPQDVYSNEATATMGIGETRMRFHNKSVWCACEIMFKSVFFLILKEIVFHDYYYCTFSVHMIHINEFIAYVLHAHVYISFYSLKMAIHNSRKI
jgi:hypothetical protein